MAKHPKGAITNKKQLFSWLTKENPVTLTPRGLPPKGAITNKKQLQSWVKKAQVKPVELYAVWDFIQTNLTKIVLTKDSVMDDAKIEPIMAFGIEGEKYNLNHSTRPRTTSISWKQFGLYKRNRQSGYIFSNYFFAFAYYQKLVQGLETL